MLEHPLDDNFEGLGGASQNSSNANRPTDQRDDAIGNGKAKRGRKVLRNQRIGVATVTRLIQEEQGIQHVEEGLLLSLIGAALTTAVGGLGTSITALYTTAGAAVSAAASG